MPGRHPTRQVQMNDQTRALLQSWQQHRKTPVGLARRARAMLLLEQVRLTHFYGGPEASG